MKYEDMSRDQLLVEVCALEQRLFATKAEVRQMTERWQMANEMRVTQATHYAALNVNGWTNFLSDAQIRSIVEKSNILQVAKNNPQ